MLSIDISSAVRIEPEADFKAEIAAFTPGGTHLVGGGGFGVCVWRVRDGKQMAAMNTSSSVRSLAISKDGRYIAAGTYKGDVLVWEAKTYKQVFADKESYLTCAVDFSPDPSRLVGSPHRYMIVWDIAARKRTLTIDCHNDVIAAKYSPEGDRIATATAESVQVWGSSDGRLLVNITVNVIPYYNAGLLWFDNRLLVVSDKTIKQFDAPTGLAVSEWPVPHTGMSSCVALAGQGKIIAFSSLDFITFWDSSTHAQVFHSQLYHGIYSIAFSSDDKCFAIATGKRLDIAHLSGTIDLFSPVVSRPILQDSGFHIDHAVLHSWKDSRLAHAETLLTTAITESQGTIHDVLASRALVRTRLGQVDSAIVDAQKSIETQPSFIGYIARFVALVGKREMLEAFRVCDIAFQLFHATHTTELLLVKAVVLFMAGEHDDAISRIDDLIKATGVSSPFCLVKTYMCILIGNEHMTSGNHDHAIGSFQRAEAQLNDNVQQPPLVVSLVSGWKFDNLRITLRQRLCEAFYAAGRIKEASEAFLETVNTLREGMQSAATWISDFRSKCAEQLHKHGDVAMKARQYDKAISEYSVALLLDTSNPQGLLVKRSRAYAASHSWESALIDANKAIELDSSSFLGYERKHAALHSVGRHNDAIDAYETMLFTISQSSDPGIQNCSGRYITPAETKKAIRAAVRKAVDGSPPELINTQSGHLLNKPSRVLSFESQPIFAELVSSMTTKIDYARIEREVTEYYQYATFSHKWEDNESLFDKVVNIVIYNLDDFPTHQKLQTFCRVVREAGLNWAWSDTCCINKGDHFVLQEALVSMFKWYHSSALTVVFLLGVERLSSWEDLTKSIWNTRAWTLQEYHASKVVRFYTQDWTPFMNLEIPNHKECPEIITEMEKATGVSAHALIALRPGLGAIQEKLRLASTRDTTRVEDAAYSLLGIFGMSLPVTYGEGDQALGRLLAQLLTSSGDTSILAWTVWSGSFNSCLPTSIAVFKELPTTHIPLALTETTTAIHSVAPGLHGAFSIDMTLAIRLHDRLNDLPVSSFSGQRMRLPCLVFKLGPVAVSRRGSECTFRARTIALGIVELRTTEDLCSLGPLYLVHPWIDFLLDRKPIGTVPQTRQEVTDSGMSDLTPLVESEAPLPDEDELLLPPSPISPEGQETHVLAFVSRLRQPFGALLLTQTRQHVQEYRRVGSESLITVQVNELTPETMKMLIQSVRVLDVL